VGETLVRGAIKNVAGSARPIEACHGYFRWHRFEPAEPPIDHTAKTGQRMSKGPRAAAFPAGVAARRAGGNDKAVSALMLSDCPIRESAAMSDRDEDFKDSFYYRAIRTRIGAALRAQFDLSQPLPERITALLTQLDKEPGGAAPAEGADTGGGTGNDPTGKPRGERSVNGS
jgi:hypothetical protein